MNPHVMTPDAKIYAAHNPDRRTPLPRNREPFHDPNPDHEPNGEYDDDGNAILGVLAGVTITLVAVAGVVCGYALWVHREAVVQLWRLL